MDGGGDYYTACDDGGVTVNDLPGTLHRLKLPTLGTMEWTYQTYTYISRGNFSPGEPSNSIVQSLGVKTKKLLDASRFMYDPRRGGLHLDLHPDRPRTGGARHPGDLPHR